jgi:hypothetical protein
MSLQISFPPIGRGGYAANRKWWKNLRSSIVKRVGDDDSGIAIGLDVCEGRDAGTRPPSGG